MANVANLVPNGDFNDILEFFLSEKVMCNYFRMNRKVKTDWLFPYEAAYTAFGATLLSHRIDVSIQVWEAIMEKHMQIPSIAGLRSDLNNDAAFARQSAFRRLKPEQMESLLHDDPFFLKKILKYTPLCSLNIMDSDTLYYAPFEYARILWATSFNPVRFAYIFDDILDFNEGDFYISFLDVHQHPNDISVPGRMQRKALVHDGTYAAVFSFLIAHIVRGNIDVFKQFAKFLSRIDLPTMNLSVIRNMMRWFDFLIPRLLCDLKMDEVLEKLKFDVETDKTTFADELREKVDDIVMNKSMDIKYPVWIEVSQLKSGVCHHYFTQFKNLVSYSKESPKHMQEEAFSNRRLLDGNLEFLTAQYVFKPEEHLNIDSVRVTCVICGAETRTCLGERHWFLEEEYEELETFHGHSQYNAAREDYPNCLLCGVPVTRDSFDPYFSAFTCTSPNELDYDNPLDQTVELPDPEVPATVEFGTAHMWLPAQVQDQTSEELDESLRSAMSHFNKDFQDAAFTLLDPRPVSPILMIDDILITPKRKNGKAITPKAPKKKKQKKI